VDLSIDKGRANGHVTPVIVSGTIGGVFVSGSGRLVSDGDGNQRLRGDEGDPGLRLTRYEQPHWGGFKLFGLFDPDEYGDGNPYDDIGGRIEDYSPGCPIGSGVITYTLPLGLRRAGAPPYFMRHHVLYADTLESFAAAWAVHRRQLQLAPAYFARFWSDGEGPEPMDVESDDELWFVGQRRELPEVITFGNRPGRTVLLVEEDLVDPDDRRVLEILARRFPRVELTLVPGRCLATAAWELARGGNTPRERAPALADHLADPDATGVRRVLEAEPRDFLHWDALEDGPKCAAELDAEGERLAYLARVAGTRQADAGGPGIFAGLQAGVANATAYASETLDALLERHPEFPLAAVYREDVARGRRVWTMRARGTLDGLAIDWVPGAEPREGQRDATSEEEI
jgi:hypothetical protein